jgi:hypothetical protein
MLMPDAGKKDLPPLPTLSSSSVSIYIDDATTRLKSSGIITASQAESSRAEARNSVTSADLPKNLTEDLAGRAVEGAISAINNMALSNDNSRIAAIEAIIAAYVAALDGRLDALVTGTRAARATEAQKAVMGSILARLASAAVKSLHLTGVTEASLPKAAGCAVGSMISSLGSGGITSDYVNSTVGAIAKAAIQTLADSGMTTSAAQTLAVQAISTGAVTAATSTGIAGVGASEYGDLVAAISQGTAQAAVTLAAGNPTSAAGFVQSAAAGSVAAIAAAASSGSIAADAVASIVAKSVEGSSAGVSSSASNVDDALALITALTGTTSQEATAIAGQDVTTMAKGIAQAASSGAVSSLGTSITASDLASAITLELAGGVTIVVDISAEIAIGMEEGLNEPPTADAGPDKTATVGSAITLTGTGTDAQAGNLTLVWKVVMAPAGSGLLDVKQEGPSFVFTPDAAGTYQLRLRVWDAGQKYADDFTFVVASVPSGKLEIGGLNAAQRLALAKDKRLRGWPAAARDDLLLLVNEYQENPSVFAEGLFTLAEVLSEIGQKNAAKARYAECYTRYPNDPLWVDRARIGPAWIDQSDKTLREASRATFAAVRDSAPVGSYAVADAIAGIAYCDMQDKKDADALTGFAVVLDQPGATPNLKGWMPVVIAQTYMNQNNLTSARASLETIFDGSFFTDEGITTAVEGGSAAISKWTMQAYHKAIALERMAKDKTALASILSKALVDPRLQGFQLLDVVQNSCQAIMNDFNDTVPLFANLPGILEANENYTSYLAGPSTGDARTAPAAAWAYLNWGNAYTRLADTLDGEPLKTAAANAITRFNTLIHRYPYINNSRSAAYARSGIVDCYLWQLGDLPGAEGEAAYATALTAAQAATVYPYPADANPIVYTVAANKMGHVLRQYGWQAKKSSGIDHVQYFLDAMYWFDRASPAYYPGVPENDWSVLDSKRNRLDCLIGLDRFAEARSAAAALMVNMAYSPNDRASFALQIPSAYRREIQDYADDKNFPAIVSLLPLMESSVDYVGTFSSGGGRYYAEALLRFVQAVERFTDEARWWDLDEWGDDIEYWSDRAIAKAGIVFEGTAYDTIRNAFSTLPSYEWYFYDMRQTVAGVLGNWGSVTHRKYDAAISVYQALYDDFESVGYTPRSRLVWLLRDWAYLYDSRGDLTDLRRLKNEGRSSEIPAAYAAGISDLQQGALRFEEVATLDGGFLEPEGQGLAYVDAGRSRMKMINLFSEYIETTAYTPTAEDQNLLEGWFTDGIEMLETVAGNGITETNYFSIKNGRVVQRAWRFLGELNWSCARLLRTMNGYDAQAMNPYLQDSVRAFRIAADVGTSARFPGADPYQRSRARSGLARRLVDLAETYKTVTPPSGVSATSLYDEALDAWALAVVDPQLNDDDRCWATMDIAGGVSRLWNLLSGTIGIDGMTIDLGDPEQKAALGIMLYQIVVDQYPFINDGRAAMDALFNIGWLHERTGHIVDQIEALRQIADDFPYVDDGERAASALFDIANLYTDLAFAAENTGGIEWATIAIGFWNLSKAAAEELLEKYDGHTDWWQISDTLNGFGDVTGDGQPDGRLAWIDHEIQRIQALSQ